MSICLSLSLGGVAHGPCPLQDGNVRLYSILGTTLKDEGKLLEAKGPVTDLAYSHDGAFLAVCDASKVVTVFSVADGYSVSGRSVLCPHAGQCGWWWRLWLLSCRPRPGRGMRPRGFILLRAQMTWDRTPLPRGLGLRAVGQGLGGGGAGREDGLIVQRGGLRE